MDAALGGKYQSGSDTPNDVFYLFENTGGEFGEPLDDPLGSIGDFATDYGFSPVFVNLDGDSDIEVVVGTYYSEIQYFDKIDGDYVEITGASSPFSAFVFGRELKLTFGDIDDDGDQDFFVGGDLDDPYSGKIRYFKNIGTAAMASFEEQTGVNNPAGAISYSRDIIPKLADIDNDGDLDLLVTDDGITNGPHVALYENSGTKSNPVFTLVTSDPFQSLTLPYNPSLGFIDLDQDGDNDFFAGGGGYFDYFLNDNPAPVTTVTSSLLSYQFDSGPIVVDAALTLTDTDGDDIVQATVSIQNYQPGNEALGFTPESPVTGNFDTSTGVLTLHGSAPLSVYQSVLRSVTYEYTGPDPGARKGGRTKAISRTIAFQTYDADLTAPTSASRTVNISSSIANQPPTIGAISLSSVVQGSASIDLAPLISDSEGNFDPNITGAINIVAQPQSGANASLNGTVLTIDYSGLSFSGNDSMQIEVCDIIGDCTTATVNITVTPSPVTSEIIVRNGLSPNSDGLNDYFKLDNIEALAPENKVSIFNRWGDKVFEIDNYDNLNRRFEGKSDNGNDLPSGVYFYKIKFSNGLSELKGYLTLKR